MVFDNNKCLIQIRKGGDNNNYTWYTNLAM
jgi:hypothetical protein